MRWEFSWALRASALQCFAEVLNQIIRTLDAHRDPDQPVGDAEFSPVFRAHSRMRGRGGPRDQSFNTTQARCIYSDLGFVNERLGGVVAALQLEAQHAAEAREKRGGNLVLRMRLEASVIHRGDLVVLAEKSRDLQRIGVLASYPQRHGFQTAL